MMNRLPCLIIRVVLVCLLLVSIVTGCASIPSPTRSVRVDEDGRLGSCADFFADLDNRIENAMVIDSGGFRVKGYPYLRVNRFLASFRNEVDDNAAFTAWVDRMQALDQAAREHEIANLPDVVVAESASKGGNVELNRRVAACGNILKEADFNDNTNKEKLQSVVSAPDEYISLRRVLGIYPLTSLFVSQGVSKWHSEARTSFSTTPPTTWKTIRYGPPSNTGSLTAQQILASTMRDDLGIPMYSPEDQEVLFNIYAPFWEIEFRDKNDRIGIPTWTDEGALEVDTDKPVTFTLLSFTRFGKNILTQLNYIIWFPSRPKEVAIDIYGGLFDGLNFRVTLDKNGDPLLYETIHNCGCYYKAYPTKQLHIREKIDYAEPPLILKAPDLVPSQHLVTVAMESGTHYVQHLYPLSRDVQPQRAVYTLIDYGRLRSLPYSGKTRRSMFAQNSIVPGTGRLERFILWPTGVLSPGGMRQFGRHAVAFVGKRHFDDPFYMDKMYIHNTSD